jgi:hypothetical protein
MEDNRSSRALARIEQALGRIEAAARQPKISPAPSGDADLERLQAKHNRLRAAVQDSLGQLDLLIEGTQG